MKYIHYLGVEPHLYRDCKAGDPGLTFGVKMLNGWTIDFMAISTTGKSFTYSFPAINVK